MRQRRTAYRVGLFGHYGNQNLGDEAIIQASIQNLRERIANIEFVGFSLNPADTSYRHEITAFPIRYKGNARKSKQSNGALADSKQANQKEPRLFNKIKEVIPTRIKDSQSIVGFVKLMASTGAETHFMRSMRDHLKNLDALLICGSNQFEDSFGGPWGFPYTLLKWVKIAKFSGIPVYFLSVGASPMKYRLSKWMLRHTLARADYLSFRDEGSKKLIEEHIPGIKGMVYPDLANSLNVSPQDVKANRKGLHIAINPMPVFNGRYWHDEDAQRYRTYLSNLAKGISHFSDQGYGTTLYNNHPADRLAIRGIMDLLQGMEIDPETVEIRQNETVSDLINTIADADIVIATRFHSTVLPLRLGIPVMGICYERKSRELLEELGLSEFSVDIHSFSYEEFRGKFEALLNHLSELKKTVPSNYYHYTASMDKQWDEIAHLIRKKAKKVI